MFTKRGSHLASLAIILPKLGFQRHGRRMKVVRMARESGSNFFLPVLSLVRVFQQIIMQQLLRSIQAHSRQPARQCPENNRKPASKAGLQFSRQMLTVR